MSENLLGVVQRLNARIIELSQRTPSAPLWAVVTSLDPLLVTPAGEADPIMATPHNGAGNLTVGARILMQRYGTQVYLWGPHVDPEPEPAVLPPIGQVLQASSLNITNGSWVKITIYSAEPITRQNVTYGNGEFTIIRPGVYVLSGSGTFAASANGRRGIGYLVKGAEVKPDIVDAAGVNNSKALAAPDYTVRLATGDKVAMRAFQDSGGTLGLTHAMFTCKFWGD